MTINVKDTVQFHGSLNPAAWQGDVLKPLIRRALLKIAKAFAETWDLKVPITDIILTGSNANYNWTKYSDFDLHLVVDMDAVPGVRSEVVRNYLLIKKTLWNKTHKITVKGFDVEVYPQHKADTLVASGVYSLQDNKWVVHPGKVRPQNEILFDDIRHLATKYMRDIDDAIASKDETVMRAVSDKIANLRKGNLSKEGEFGLHNLTFKVLRNSKYIDKLHTAIEKVSDKELSVEQQNLISFGVFIAETLTPAGRYKKKRVMQRNRYKLKHRSDVALEISSSPRRLKIRAMNAARRKLYKMLAGVKNKKKLTSTQKAEVERILKRKDPVYLKSMPRQLTPKLRRLDSKRLTKKTK